MKKLISLLTLVLAFSFGMAPRLQMATPKPLDTSKWKAAKLTSKTKKGDEHKAFM